MSILFLVVFKMIEHIFLDFNGTLIDDVDLCLNLLNQLLKSQNKKEIDIKRYKEIFTFPIIDYYEAAGIDFNIESFDSLAIKFIQSYQPQSLLCGLYSGVIDTLKYLKNKGVKLYILSASEKKNLLEQCRHYDIVKYFDEILGIDDIHAKGKVEIAKEFIKNSDINLENAIFVGDTLHDYEVACAMGIECRLVCCGHQSRKRLETTNAIIYEDIRGLMQEV